MSKLETCIESKYGKINNVNLHFSDTSRNNPAPKINCDYKVFDPFTDKELTNATAKYLVDGKILELANIDNEMPYILKNKDNQERLRFYLMTDMKNNEKTANKTFVIESDYEDSNLSIKMDATNFLHRFLSFILIRGKRKLRVNEFNYDFRQKEDTISININKDEKCMDIELTSKFDYKSSLDLDISLNGHKLMLELIFILSNPFKVNILELLTKYAK